MDEFENKNLNSGAENADDYTVNSPEKADGIAEASETASPDFNEQASCYMENKAEYTADTGNVSSESVGQSSEVNANDGKIDEATPSAGVKKEKKYAYPLPGEKSAPAKKNRGAIVFASIATALCVFLMGTLVYVVIEDIISSPVNNVPELPDEYVELVTEASPETELEDSDGQMTPRSIYNKVLPSSVGILVYDKSKNLASEGTGVLFQESDDGKYTYIITCAHVVAENEGYIRVQLSDGEEYTAALVGFDAKTDIAVVGIEAGGLTLAEIGDSTKLFVGDPIYAIGNPGGVEFANSFTSGIVSAIDRPVNSSATGYTMDCIQHTSAINPGNSGGALVNSFGQVIGINSMKIVADEYEGMGFAVPSSVFVEIVNEIMANGYVANRPKLGITYVPASEYENYGMFVALKDLPSGSIVIYEITEDSALADTDAQVGDMIIAVNGTPLDDTSYLPELIENSDVGDKITLTLIRIFDDYSYEEFDVEATLVEDRGDKFIIQEEPETIVPDSGFDEEYYEDYFGQYFDEFFNDYFGGFAP